MATLSVTFPCVLLTGRNSCGILCYDNDSCHLDKKDCQAREVLYDTAKSFKGAQSCTKCESAGKSSIYRRKLKMKNDEIKQANRKALPKFLLFAVVCTIVGGVVGYYSGHGAAKGGLDQLVGMMKEAGAFFGTHIAPWLMLALAVIVPVVCIPIYRRAKKLVAAWDGEDEDISDTVDRKLSAVIWTTSVALIVSYFLIAASYSGGFATFDSKNSTIIFFIGVVAFFGIMAEATIIQQKCVDTAKPTPQRMRSARF